MPGGIEVEARVRRDHRESLQVRRRDAQPVGEILDVRRGLDLRVDEVEEPRRGLGNLLDRERLRDSDGRELRLGNEPVELGVRLIELRRVDLAGPGRR